MSFHHHQYHPQESVVSSILNNVPPSHSPTSLYQGCSFSPFGFQPWNEGATSSDSCGSQLLTLWYITVLLGPRHLVQGRRSCQTRTSSPWDCRERGIYAMIVSHDGASTDPHRLHLLVGSEIVARITRTRILSELDPGFILFSDINIHPSQVSDDKEGSNSFFQKHIEDVRMRLYEASIVQFTNEFAFVIG